MYKSLEGCLIASLWLVSSARRNVPRRKLIRVILLALLAMVVVLDQKLYKAEMGNIPAIMLVALLALLTVMVHEISHGWVALQLGDPTAKDQGRLTLNPLKHASFRWTLLFPITVYYLFKVPLMLPKPVPINPRNFENPRKGIMWVGIAGPAVNLFFMLVLALVVGSGIVPSGKVGTFVRELLILLLILNMGIAMFNLLPIPPLDGSRLLIGFLPPKQAAFLMKIHIPGLALILSMVIGAQVIFGIDRVVIPVIEFMWRMLGLDPMELQSMFTE